MKAIGKLLLLLFLLSGPTSWAFPVTSVLDTFTRANSATVGPNWTGLSVCDPDNMGISSNAAVDHAGLGSGASEYWNQFTLPSSKFEVYVTVTTLPASTDWVDVWALDTPDNCGGNYFRGYVLTVTPPNSWNISSQTGTGSGNDIGDFTQTFNAGDSFGMSKLGNTITLYYEPSGGSWTVVGTTTDTNTFNNLYLGMELSDTTLKATNFGGGSYGALINNAKINKVKMN